MATGLRWFLGGVLLIATAGLTTCKTLISAAG